MGERRGIGSPMTVALLAIDVLLVLLVLPSTVTSQRYAGDSCNIRGTGAPGICRSIYQCSSARRTYETQGIRPTNCGFSGNTPIVCCEEEGQTTTTTTTTRRPINNYDIDSRRISEIKCDEYSADVVEIVEALPLLPDAVPLSFKTEKCGFDSTELIVGGHDAKLGEYPHMALIGWIKQYGQDYKWKCGGTLISENYVLTAAHCTYVNDEETTSAEPSVVRLGEHNLASNSDGASPVDIPISSMIKHPDYRPPSKYHDICLFQLQNSVRFSKLIRPACLWVKPNLEDRIATATGWGDTSYMGTRSDILQSVTLNLIDSNTCASFFPRDRKLRNGIIAGQLCAGNLTGGSDTCQGDSGGPLEVSQKSNRCIHYVIGVTSFGNGCASANTAGVYTRVSNYVDWIERIVWSNN